MLLKNFWATLKRYKVASVLNIIGLSIAFAAFAVMMMQVHYDFSFDRFHSNSNRIFRVEVSEGNGEFFQGVSRPISRAITQSSASIQQSAVLSPGYWMVTKENEPENTAWGEHIYRIESPLLQMFDFNLVAGDTARFSGERTVIIPQSMADRLYPGESAVGKVLHHQLGRGENPNPYEIIAVYENFPRNSTLGNLIYTDIGERDLNSNAWNCIQFLLLSDASRKDAVAEEIFASAGEFLELDGQQKASAENYLRLTPFTDLHFQKDIPQDMMEKGNKGTVFTLLSIALLIILIAMINFINFSTSLVPVRIRAVNTQRVLGNPVWNIRWSMIWEGIGTALIAVFVSYWIVYYVSNTSLANFLSADISLSNGFVMTLTTLIAVLTGLLAGLYPAFYITSFTPALVLKGSFGLTPKGVRLRTVLISFQYVISLILIIVAIFIQVQNSYMKKYPMGFDKENVLVINVSGTIDQETLSRELLANPNIQQVAYASDLIVSKGWNQWEILLEGETMRFHVLPVTTDFIELMGIRISEGRGFTAADNLRDQPTIVFNETARKTYGLTLDKNLNMEEGNPMLIAGFMEDFHFQPLHYTIGPMAFYVAGSDYSRFNWAYIRAGGRNISSTLEYIDSTVRRIDPLAPPVNAWFLDESIGNLYRTESRIADLISLFSLLAIFISIIGAFGLILFETQYRRKEIGIRKINGATVAEVLALFNKTFVRIVLVCFVIAAPVSYYVITRWLEGFAYKSAIHLWIFVAALLVVMLITILTVTLQSYRAATENPANAIKSE